MFLFVLQVVLFVLGTLAFAIGKIPLTRRRLVCGSAVRIVGAILMIPLPLYLVVCLKNHVQVLGSAPVSSEGHPRIQQRGDQFGGSDEAAQIRGSVPKGGAEMFAQFAAVLAISGCLLAATVLALIASETRRRP